MFTALPWRPSLMRVSWMLFFWLFWLFRFFWLNNRVRHFRVICHKAPLVGIKKGAANLPLEVNSA
jgi:hypothetical protein